MPPLLAIHCPVGLPRYPHHRFISRRNLTGSSVQSVRNTRHFQRLYAAASDDAADTSPSDDALPDTPPEEDTATPPGFTGASDAGQAESGSQSSGPSTSASSAGGAAAAPLSSAEEAAAVVASCLELIQERRLDELLTYVPDEVIDRCLQRRKQRCTLEVNPSIYSPWLFERQLYTDSLCWSLWTTEKTVESASCAAVVAAWKKYTNTSPHTLL